MDYEIVVLRTELRDVVYCHGTSRPENGKEETSICCWNGRKVGQRREPWTIDETVFYLSLDSWVF